MKMSFDIFFWLLGLSTLQMDLSSQSIVLPNGDNIKDALNSEVISPFTGIPKNDRDWLLMVTKAHFEFCHTVCDNSLKGRLENILLFYSFCKLMTLFYDIVIR